MGPGACSWKHKKDCQGRPRRAERCTASRRFLLAQVAVMPMMGMPLFSGSTPMALGSLVGHLIYGATVGAVYGPGSEVRGRQALTA